MEQAGIVKTEICGMARRVTIQMHSRMAWVVTLVPILVMATILPNKEAFINTSILMVISKAAIKVADTVVAEVEPAVATAEVAVDLAKPLKVIILTTSTRTSSNN